MMIRSEEVGRDFGDAATEAWNATAHALEQGGRMLCFGLALLLMGPALALVWVGKYISSEPEPKVAEEPSTAEVEAVS